MDHNQKFDFADSAIVYVRPMKSADLPDDVRQQVGDVEEVFAIMDAQGGPVALARDRDMAFNLARINELSPVSVH